MSLTKRKVSVSLDEALVEEFEREDVGFSAQVNAAVGVEVERRRRLLVELLDQLDAERGPVDKSLLQSTSDSSHFRSSEQRYVGASFFSASTTS